MPGFKPKGKQIEKLPEHLAKQAKSSEIEATTPVSKMGTMFATTAQPVYAPLKIKKPKGALKKAEEALEKAEEALEKAEEAEEPLEKLVKPVKPVKSEASDDILGDIESDDLNEMKVLIENEKKGYNEDGEDKFYEPTPSSYVHTTSRGFSDFIKQTYSSFMLDPSTTAPPDQEKYPYQRFIREYMRNESPYRGILTYHGLGSGKTCTAIATAEALYSRGHKKIIVMTPFSLRKNFLKEVSLCGFRHYRLNNFWTSMPVSDADARLFATSVLGIPESHLRTATYVWIPDFRQKEPN